MKMERAQQKQTTLVLGGTGKTGRRVALRLAARGVPTRVVSRSGEPPFDWENEATWAPALRDVESVYVSCSQTSQSRVRWRRFARSPSWPWRVESGGSCFYPAAARRVAQAVQEGRRWWTIVRCSWFMQNFSENLLEPILSGEVVSLRRTSSSRSSTPTISPMSPSRRRGGRA